MWAKHLVEAEGDAEEAKWRYVKERAGTAATRKSNERKAREEQERRAYAEDQRLKKEHEERKRKQGWIKKGHVARRESEEMLSNIKMLSSNLLSKMRMLPQKLLSLFSD